MESIRLASSAFQKTPSETLKRDLSFSNLLASSETIASITSATASPVGLVVNSSVASGQSVQLEVSSGTAGTVYEVTVLAVTSNDQTVEGRLRVSVRG